MTTTVMLDVRDHVATLTLNRPDAANALDMALGRDLHEAVLAIEHDRRVRAVLFTGAGKHFCFGGDLRGMIEGTDNVAAYLTELTDHIHAALAGLARMRAPVIAAIQGTVAGGGVGLVCAADLAIAGRGAKFRLAYTGVGLAPDCSTSFMLPRMVGYRRAMELLLLNRMLSAEEALAWGLVNQVVDDAELLTQAQALAAQLAAGPTESYAAVKRLLLSSEPGLESQMSAEARAIAAMAAHPHGQEAVRAFLEKRKPNFAT